MKRTLLSVLLFVCCLPALAQHEAQVYTENDFQGQWKLVAYITSDGTLNMNTGKAEADIKMKAKYGDAYADEAIKKLEDEVEDLKQSYLEVSGKKFTLGLKDNVRSGTFKLKRDKDNNQVLVAKFKDNSQSTGHFVMKDNDLVLTHYSGDKYIFEKKTD